MAQVEDLKSKSIQNATLRKSDLAPDQRNGEHSEDSHRSEGTTSILNKSSDYS